jgi:CopG family transcriptional regulator, nickel-responsive regulator
MLSRIGVSLDEELLCQFDEVIEEKGYTNRSEAMRDLIRETLVKREWESATDDKSRIAVVTIVYDHDEHELGHKLTHIQHDSHDLIISTMHVHMDERNCLEVQILKGAAADIVRLGNTLISTRGVKMGKLTLATTGDKF